MNATVLVVGAGPTGLTAACLLRRYGVAVHVLEAAPVAAPGSRAVALWPPALGALAAAGVLEAAERAGYRARALNFVMPGGRSLRVPLGSANEPLILPQVETERLLAEALAGLGTTVQRGVEVVGVTDAGDRVVVTARGPDGVRRFAADWLIAADGVRSTVRRCLDIGYAGDRIQATYLLAEGTVEGGFARDELHYVLGRSGTLVVAPLPDGTVRVGGGVPDGTPADLAAVQRLLDERGAGRLRMREVAAIGTFTSAERVAVTLRRGRCFLTGDAAHTHAAVGGQGLNLALEDARNLAWKLAGVVQGRFDPSILDSYHRERRPAAADTVRLTRTLARLALYGPVKARIRNAVWRLAQASGLLRRRYAPVLAGSRGRYGDGVVVAGPARRGLPAAGTRVPGWLPVPAARWPGFGLVTLGSPDGALARRAGAIAARFPALVEHRHLARRGGGFVLVRPDGYVAASGAAAAALAGVETLLADLTPGGPPSDQAPGRTSRSAEAAVGQR